MGPPQQQQQQGQMSSSSSQSSMSVCTIHTELVIPAPPAAVWAVFGDFARWGDWNDFMTLPVPPAKVGQHCKVLFRLSGGCVKTSVHDPEVIVLDEDKELRWRDYRPLLAPFFRGSHWWVLEPLPGGRGTRLVHGAEMMGLAIPFLWATMRATERGYERFNEALRDEVLRRAAAGKRRPGRASAVVAA